MAINSRTVETLDTCLTETNSNISPTISTSFPMRTLGECLTREGSNLKSITMVTSNSNSVTGNTNIMEKG